MLTSKEVRFKLNKKAPCPVCPDKLGIIKAVVSPCPHCKMTGYSFYYKHTQGHGEIFSTKPGKK